MSKTKEEARNEIDKAFDNIFNNELNWEFLIKYERALKTYWEVCGSSKYIEKEKTPGNFTKNFTTKEEADMQHDKNIKMKKEVSRAWSEAEVKCSEDIKGRDLAMNARSETIEAFETYQKKIINHFKAKLFNNTKLQNAIIKRGLSLKEVSTLAEISTVQLRALIKGHAKNPRLKTIQKLAKALNVKESDLGFFK
tara:strand:+ start:207 stop:791 length:585 start_codon:yes stop_codon:yes gene_type:complete